MPVDHLLKRELPVLIDGGLSNVLEEKGCDLNHKLWTGRLLKTNPEAIVRAHLDYLLAGAQIITTASYQASFPGLMELGYSKAQAEKLILKSVELAEQAIQRFCDMGHVDFAPLIAASIGPYGAYLADGSEYRGNYGVSDETLVSFHLERIHLLDDSNVDLLAVETIPSFQEAQVLAELLLHINNPAWISFSCQDGKHLNDGSQIKEAVKLFKGHPKVFAIGVNCTKPQYISDIIKDIKAVDIGKKIVVYPNSGEAYHAESKTWMGISDPDAFVEMAREWLANGANLVGGCCRIGPEHIRKMSGIVFKT